MAEEKYPYPSLFGSHSSMVVEDLGAEVICQDEFGTYKTAKNRLDNGLADSNRYVPTRLSKLFGGSKKRQK